MTLGRGELKNGKFSDRERFEKRKVSDNNVSSSHISKQYLHSDLAQKERFLGRHIERHIQPILTMTRILLLFLQEQLQLPQLVIVAQQDIAIVLGQAEKLGPLLLHLFLARCGALHEIVVRCDECFVASHEIFDFVEILRRLDDVFQELLVPDIYVMIFP